MEQITCLKEALERLSELRDTGERCSDEVVDLYNTVIEDAECSLGADRWLVLEQVVVASLDVGAESLTFKVYALMKKQFDGSQRLRRLEARIRESQELFEEAEQIYRTILEEDPVDSATLKRLVALQKALNKPLEAVNLLNHYLETNTLDFEAWLELCDVYLLQSEYEKAGFCMEEVILSSPHNHLYHQRYAEIKYSQGDFDAARIYFSQANRLSSGSMRALFGMALCAQKLAYGKSKSKAENLKLVKKSVDKISSLCKGAALERITTDACSQLCESL